MKPFDMRHAEERRLRDEKTSAELAYEKARAVNEARHIAVSKLQDEAEALFRKADATRGEIDLACKKTDEARALIDQSAKHLADLDRTCDALIQANKNIIAFLEERIARIDTAMNEQHAILGTNN